MDVISKKIDIKTKIDSLDDDVVLIWIARMLREMEL
jgi:hypothetical protein